jgi:hypothetical protein
MSSVPPTISAEIALSRQNVALSSIKHGAEQDQKLAQILEDSSRKAPVNQTRGSNVNLLV